MGRTAPEISNIAHILIMLLIIFFTSEKPDKLIDSEAMDERSSSFLPIAKLKMM